MAIRGGLVLAGVLLLVIFPQPVEEDDNTEGAAWDDDTDADAGTARSLTARWFGVEVVARRFSLDSRVWLVLARGVGRGVVVGEAFLELLVGVLGTVKESSWKMLDLES